MNKGHPVCGIHSGPVNELLMFITPYVVENSTQIREGGSIPVAEEGFKTLEQSRKIIEDKMMGLGIGFDAEQEVDAP